MTKNFSITSYHLDETLETEVRFKHQDFLNWPLVYFLRNEQTKDAYVGETTDVLTRLKTHSKTAKKQHLKSVNIILSELFNKSATLDLEANLIRYIAADGKYALQNGNLGISNHRYYDQKSYWTLFEDVWSELRSMGITQHSLEYIDNSDLFKYSPYKSLSKEQVNGLKTVLHCLLDENAKVSLIKGGAGTGKSILAIFLMKLLKTSLDDFNFADFDEEDQELYDLVKAVKEKYGELNMALVIPMASFRKTVANVFKNIKGLSAKMVIGPSELTSQKYDLILVDEGHRLRKRTNLGSYFGTFDKNCELLGLDKMTASELDWVKLQAHRSIIFYDVSQSIKPSDVKEEDFEDLQLEKSTRIEELKTQFRVKGGNDYVKLVHRLFNPVIQQQQKQAHFSEYDLFLFEDVSQMVKEIRKREANYGLSRLIAGFAWEWISNKDKSLFDIQIGNTHLKWNSVAVDWVNSPNAISEVGCIHTTQGYDLNYAGIIIGPELDYDFETNEFVVYKERYKDKNGKNSIADLDTLKAYIINIYKTILLRGIRGTYIYVCNDNLRRYFQQFIPTFESANTQNVIELFDEPGENRVPYYDLSVAAGSFSEEQMAGEPQYLQLHEHFDANRYFACKVVGESMNKVIPNGRICLFRKDEGGSRNGLICLVESATQHLDESGAQYTIKEYLSKKTITEEGWNHREIHLIPRSTNANFETLILKEEELESLQVKGVFVRVVG